MIVRWPWVMGLIGVALALCACQGKADRMGYCFDAAYDPGRGRLYVAAGYAGLHTLEVTGQGLEYVSTYHDGGYYRNLEVRDGRAYIADTERGLVVLDLSGDAPAAKWAQTGVGMGLSIDGELLYLAAGKHGLFIYDLQHADEPKMLSHFEDLDQAWDVWARQGWAFVADVNKGLVVIDARSPARPQRAGFVTWDAGEPMAEVVQSAGDFVFIAAGKHGLVVVDARERANPLVAARYDPGPDSFGEGLFVQGQRIYLTVGDERQPEQNGLHILDVAKPYAPQLLGVLPLDDWVEGVIVAQGQAFISSTFSGVRSADVRDPAHPVLVGRFSMLP